MTRTSTLLALGFAALLTFIGVSTTPAMTSAHTLSLTGTNDVQPQFVHRRHRAHRGDRHSWKHHHHRPVLGLGHRLHRLPHGFFGITFGGTRFYLHGGVFHRRVRGGFIVVKAPYGAVIKTLPHGYHIIHQGSHTYYHYNDTYYAINESGAGYVVVPDPRR